MTFAGFQVADGEALTLEGAVYQALGAASMCWEKPEGAGVFDSASCKDVAESLIAFLRSKDYIPGMEQLALELGYPKGTDLPSLGLANTRHMLTELQVRGDIRSDVDGTILGAYAKQGLESLSRECLDYRPVDS